MERWNRSIENISSECPSEIFIHNILLTMSMKCVQRDVQDHSSPNRCSYSFPPGIFDIRSKISKSAKAHAPPLSRSLGEEIFIRIYLCSIRVAIVKYMNTHEYAHEIINEISSWRTWAIDQRYRAGHPVSSTRPTSARDERISITEVNFLMVVLKRLTLTQFPGRNRISSGYCRRRETCDK